MNEYISRGDILDIAFQYCPDDDGSCSKADVDLREMLDEIEALPSADVQPVKRGRWIDIYEWAKMHDSTPSGMCTYYWCSECQTEQEKRSNFCPSCGAKMIEKPNLQLLKNAVELIKKAKEIKVDEARMNGDTK